MSNGQNELQLISGEHGFELPREGSENWVLRKEFGYSPVRSLVAAVGACGGYVYQEVLENSKIPAVFHKVELRYERNPDKKAEPLKRIEVTFFVTVAEELKGRAERSVRLVSQHCPVIQSLDPTIEVVEKVEFI